MALKLGTPSALNLTLQGSVGSFSVGHGSNGRSSVEVKYFLTHVGLDFESGTSAEVLQHLVPVREMFDAGTLEFDELMQRDIDDARVSSELIPYLLDQRSRDLVKLFPPIIVVVLPIKPGSSSIEGHYPEVTRLKKSIEGQDVPFLITRSGAVGQEAFEFQQPMDGEKPLDHDLVRLLLNTNRVRLVIVDGQHRAMALLALYRNLKQDWSNVRRAPFKDYYEEWTENYIREFDIKRISIPVMFCTFPSLDENYQGDYDLKKAARAIFLTLNKTARKVTDSRNRLLDDNDLIALFMRDTLSTIKQKDVRSPRSLRMCNIELDQPQDRTKIADPIAVSGVNHVYYMIEHMILNHPSDVKHVKPRSGKFWKRTDLAPNASRRLKMLDNLGMESAAATSRDFFTAEAGEKLTIQFRQSYGNYIVKAFEHFEPFEAHNKAAIWLENKLRSEGNQKLRPILFEGQGIGRVFEQHRKNLHDKKKNRELANTPQIDAIIARQDATANLIKGAVDDLKKERARYFLDGIGDKAKLRDGDGEYVEGVVEFVNKVLYESILRTVAFETAMVAGFFGEIERANDLLSLENKPPLVTNAEFEEFLAQMNAFFTPKSSADFRRLVECFLGRVEGEIKDWKIAASATTFRQVVYRGEMQPDEWPKYKYLMLEIWRPSDKTLGESVARERESCRNQIFNSLVEEVRRELLQRLTKRPEALDESEQRQVIDDAFEAFKAFLRNLDWKVTEIPSKKAMIERTTTDSEDAEQATSPEEQVWEESEAP